VLLAVYTKRLVPQPPDRLLQITGQAHARIPFSQQAGTVSQLVRQSQLPETVVAAPFRRVTKAQGPVARKMTTTITPRRRGVPLISTLAVGRPTVIFLQRPLPGWVTPAVTASQVDHVRQAAAVPQGQPPNPQMSRLLLATEAIQAYYDYTNATGGPPPSQLPSLPLTAVKSALLAELHPQKTIQAQASARLKRPERGASNMLDDSLDLALPVPSFPQPMYEALKPLSQDFLLPGVEQIPPNSVLLLETNPEFIEAFLVGLNHEMSRELLWREYPTELRLTYFQRFWDTPGSGNGPPAVQIPAMHTWQADAALGRHFMNGQSEGQLALLIRGELLRRYPNTVVYAVEATPDHQLGDHHIHPSFRGVMEPDITILGFALTAEQARSGSSQSGWFFVIEQPPTEVRFGLDVATEFGRHPNALTSWNQLSWGDLVANEAEFQRLTYVPVHGHLYLFSLAPGFAGDLDNQQVSNDLKQAFQMHNQPLTPQAQVVVNQVQSTWTIIDGNRKYAIRRESQTLNVYGHLDGKTLGAATWGLNGGHMAAITVQHPVRIARHADRLLPPMTGEEA
jgi:hypothetical protein